VRKQFLIYVPLVAKCLPKIRQSPIHGSGRMTRHPEVDQILDRSSLTTVFTIRTGLISAVIGSPTIPAPIQRLISPIPPAPIGPMIS
jgi:hypothetical protein